MDQGKKKTSVNAKLFLHLGNRWYYISPLHTQHCMLRVPVGSLSQHPPFYSGQWSEWSRECEY